MTTMSAMIAFTALSALATLVLIGAEVRSWAAARVIAKYVAAGSFIVVGVVARGACPMTGSFATFQMLVGVGLVFGAIGDISLLGKSDRHFLGGLGAFLVGHLAYVVAIAALVAPGAWLSHAGLLAAAPVVVGGGALAWLWPKLGSMRGPVIAYVITIIAMVVGALAVLGTEAIPARNRQLLALGAVLFFASDLAVARDKFVATTVVNRVWGLPCYFAGQLLIAWSLLPGGPECS
jgi:uncharacterized membrane protein YhhN